MYPCNENKGAISFAVTAKLICAFVFAYAKIRFSHDAAHDDSLSIVSTDRMLKKTFLVANPLNDFTKTLNIKIQNTLSCVFT